MKLLLPLVLIIMWVGSNPSHAQDVRFSQFYLFPIYLNPAMAGSANEIRAITIHRRQWRGNLNYLTSGTSVDAAIGKRSGVALSTMYDRSSNGIYKNLTSELSLSHEIPVGEDAFIASGLKVGFFQNSIDLSRLVFEDMLDPRYGQIRSTGEYAGSIQNISPDVTAGLMFGNEYLIGGVSVAHMNRPGIGFNNESVHLPMKYTIHVGAFLPVNKFVTQDRMLSPNLIYESQGQFEYWNLGMFFSSNGWIVGGWYRPEDAVIVSTGITVDQFKFGYSFDYSIRSHTVMAGHSHEISASFLFSLPRKFKVKNRYKGKCPSFFKYIM